MTDQPQGSGFSTLAIHAGAGPDPTTRARATPIYQTNSFVLDDADHAAALFGLQAFGNTSSRLGNPTCAVLEERMAALEGGTAALAVASGHAARLLVFQTLLQPGDEFVASRNVCGGTADQFEHAFRSFGWQVRWADPARPESVVDSLSDRTKAIFTESIAHPGGVVTDIEAIASVARRARLPLVVDNTLATPYLVRPFEHGADIIVHSATSFLGGHGQALGGVIVDGGSFDWVGEDRYPALSAAQPSYGGMVLADTFGNFAFATACRALGLRDLGCALSPFHAFLILNGVETLALRMQRHCDNALTVAQHLARHSRVAWVRHAGLPSDESHGLAQRYCPTGVGAVFTFGLAGGYEAGTALVTRLRLFSHVADVGDTRSLVIHPASSSHRHVADAQKMMVGPDVVRVSIGLEDVADIIADLDQALG